jgi:O-antigen/teichoic acid export membrane protein
MKDIKKTLNLGLALSVKLLAGLYAVNLCAQILGPDSFGVTGQLSSLLAILSLLAGAGISVGVTKIYSGQEFSIATRPEWLKAAGWIASCSAVLLSTCFLLFADPIVEHIFQRTPGGLWLLGGLIFATLPVAFAGIGQGKINGSHRDDLYALSIIAGSIVGLIGLWGLGHYFGQTGALLGMIWLVVAQALVMNIFGKQIDCVKKTVQKATVAELGSKIKFLLSYGLVSMAAGLVIPITYIFIRLLVQQHSGNKVYGLWQANLRISEAYTQLPLMMLSVVLFARFASSASIGLDKIQVRRTYAFMAGLMFAISFFIYTLREYWIKIVFNSDFLEMEHFVVWQLAGDFLRVLSYVATTILAARGALKLCVIGEVVQAGLLLASSMLLIPLIPVYGVLIAYISTYGVYLLITIYMLLSVKE